MDQQLFDFDAVADPEPVAAGSRPLTIDERFEAYHEANPAVFTEFKRLANQLRAKGYPRYSAKGLFEVIRFRTAIDGRPGDAFKLNNNYSSRYTRMLLAEDETFEGFFETRALKGVTQ